MSRSITKTTARAAAVVFVMLLIGVAICAGLWRQHGGQWFVVTSPSMGTAAPVNSLVITAPVDFDDIEVGDFVTFRSPDSGLIFSHRIVEVTADGLKTRGDINSAPDPWTIHKKDVVGEVAYTIPAVGVAVRAAGLIGAGSAAVWFLTSRLQRQRRRPLRVLGYSWVVALTSMYLEPWVGLERLPTDTSPDAQASLDVVSTGLLPIRVSGAGSGDAAVLHNGEVAHLRFADGKPGTEYIVDGHIALGFLGWLIIAPIIVSPLLTTLFARVPTNGADKDEPSEAEQELVGSA